ncbi:MAG TPA: phosphonate C-P lyase system protein PhnH, partial [Puia sp.]|nr:phosphonate C-P lyase system protein PhnH [Puia sp.]
MQRETVYDPVFDAQGHYRLLLDAMARPGKINTLPQLPLAPPPGLSAAAALTGFALLDQNASFCVEDGDAATVRYLVVNTSSRPEGIANADFVFAAGTSPADLIPNMKKGSLSYPDEGATLILDVEELGSPALSLTLSGPGIAGEKTFFVSGLNPALLEALQECNAEFPQGIDLILT